MVQAVDSTRGNHIPDATKMMASINEMETVEPVAYVTGYRDGFCVINPVEHVVFPTGMALYISPPTSQESRQVEPVAWMRPDRGHVCFHKYSEYVPLYSAPPKREPLTDEEIESAVCAAYVEKVVTRYDITIARAIERAHGIGETT